MTFREEQDMCRELREEAKKARARGDGKLAALLERAADHNSFKS